MKRKFLNKWKSFITGMSYIFNPFGNSYSYTEYNISNLNKEDIEVLRGDMNKVFEDIDKVFETLSNINKDWLYNIIKVRGLL